MRSYGQYCAMARALDVVGDRWTLLVVRELWLRPLRFGGLSEALPNVASNLLADRLKKLEAAGVVEKSVSASATYSLTERGVALEPVMQQLIRWGELEMEREIDGDVYRNAWFAQALESLVPLEAVEHAMVFGLKFDDGGPPAVVVAEPAAGLRVARGAEAESAEPEAEICGDPSRMVAVVAGRGRPEILEIVGSKASAKRLRGMLRKVVAART